MELKQVYEQIGGDYENVVMRLLSDQMIIKFLFKLIDNNLEKRIVDALAVKDYETAFREAHNLKGVCANLGLDMLMKSASALSEALRSRNPQGDITDLVDNMRRDYAITVQGIKSLNS